MMGYAKIFRSVLCILISLTFFSCSGKCDHQYSAQDIVSPTCLSDGYTEYTCSLCGDTYRETSPKLAHTPGAEPTFDEAQSCTVCGTVLKDKLAYTPYSGTELPINYKYGYAKPCLETLVDSQYHGKYEEYILYYNDSSMLNDKPLRLSIPTQEFYTHSICSVEPVRQTDGKSYITDAGFKLRFNFARVDIPAGNPETAWEDGLKKAFYNTPDHMLAAVATYPATDKFFNSIYEVVDFSDSSIQIVRTTENGDEIVKDISSVSEWEGMLSSNGEITDANGSLFYAPGRYKITFKYCLAWFATPASKLYNQKDPDGIYPHGFFDYQYDTFYITVTDKACGVLLPNSDDLPTEEFFCQLSADVIKQRLPFMVLPDEKMTLYFGDNVTLQIRAKVDAGNDRYYYDRRIVDHFTLAVSYYDTTTDSYQNVETHDLLSLLKYSNTVGEALIVTLTKDPILRGKSCRFTVSYSYRDPETGIKVSEQQRFDYVIDWR